MKNDRLMKLLYYTTPDCLTKPNLTEDQMIDLFGKNIKIVPKLYVDNSVLNYIVITFDNFTTNNLNPEFRNNTIEFDIICHFDQWQMKDFELRPYKIAAELDSMLNQKILTGFGKLIFVGAKQAVLTNEYAGICLRYQVVHGGDDKQNALKDEKALDINFDNMFNN